MPIARFIEVALPVKLVYHQVGFIGPASAWLRCDRFVICIFTFVVGFVRKNACIVIPYSTGAVQSVDNNVGFMRLPCSGDSN
jgi:hypothetical protein